MLSVEEKIRKIMESTKISEVQNSDIIPEPAGDEGYYFVSYSHKDYKKVFCTVIELMEKGVKIWYDRGLETGKSWLASVKNRIYSYDCKGVIFFVSDEFLLSDSIADEILATYSQKKPSVFVDITEKYANADEPVGILKKENVFDAFSKLFNEKTVLDGGNCNAGAIAKILSTLPQPKLFRYTYDDNIGGACMLSTNDLTLKKAKIPSEIRMKGRTVPVAGIGELCFANCTMLKYVSIGGGWREIREKAFHNCRDLEWINLSDPGEEATFCLSALDYCEKLKELRMPAGVEVFASFDSAPQNSVERLVVVPSSGEKYVGRFEGMKKLKYADISVCDEMSPAAFKDCAALEEVRLGEGMKKIELSAFHGCGSLKDVVLPESVEDAEPFSFANCVSLKALDTGERKRLSLGIGAFYGCRNIKTVRLSAADLRLYYYAFARCDGLESVTLKCGKALVELNSFADCKNLRRVVLDCGGLKTFDFRNTLSDTEAKLLAGSVDTSSALKTVCVDDVFGCAKEIYVRQGCRAKFSGKFLKAQSDMSGFDKYVHKGDLKSGQ